MTPAARSPRPWRAILAALLCLPGSLHAATRTQSPAPQIDEVVVTARLREAPLARVPASVSIVPQGVIEARQAQHLEELLNAVPNVNFNLGASRGRFVQIRGIGERSQFVDPVDPSVGLFIDGIDFSGLGSAGTLFDVEQVEVLRGPQGTAFGASAMAGLVNIRSTAPTPRFDAALHASLSEYQGRSLGVNGSGPLAPSLGARLALQRYRSDGYMENDTLGRRDTNAIDETSARLRLAWQAGEALELGLSALRADVDNGYDAFSLDNSRHTLADEPGHDRQRSDALALSARWGGAAAFDVEATATWSDSELDYGYDEDWAWPGICAGQPCEGWEYASTDRYLRGVGARSLDLRLLSRAPAALDWVAGLYTSRRDTALERRFLDFSRYPPPPARFESDYGTVRNAAYAELGWSVTPAVELGAGVRAERFEASYDDSLGVQASPEETLWGGQLSAEYAFGEHAMGYLLLSRGFKAGGVNGEAIGKARQAALDPSIIAFLERRAEFATETLWNYEAGLRRQFAAGWLGASVFWMRRDDVQLKAWYNEGPQFVGYTDNAARGENRGAELEALWQPRSDIDLTLGLGLLDTRVDDFVANDPDRGLVDKSGRDQAQAPDWQFHAALEWRFLPRFFARLEWEGKDAYYFSDSDEQRADASRLLHLSAGWHGERLAASAWLRNALDEEYAVHGFYFGNDPRKFYANEPYYQWGAPRVAGLTLDYRFGD